LVFGQLNRAFDQPPSRFAAISRFRKFCNVPLANGGWSTSRQSSTNCQRRSITVASITSSSEAPVYACRIVARAS
jgi:hypothetical protein